MTVTNPQQPAAPPPPVVMIDPTGRAVELPAEQAASAKLLGYGDSSPEAQSLFRTKRDLVQKYGGAGQAFLAGLEGAGSALSFGTSTGIEQLLGVDPNDIRQRELAHPTASTIGNILGAAAPLAIPGIGEALSLSAPASIARLGGAASEAVEAALPEVLGTTTRRVASRVAGSAIEGAAYGTGQTVHEGMIDPKLAAESAVANVGFGSLLGAGFGGGGELLSGIAKASAPKVVPWLRDLEGSQYAKSLGLDADSATIRDFKDAGLIGPFTSPARFLQRSQELLRRAQESGEAAMDAEPDVISPAREEAAKLAGLAQKGIDLAQAAGEQTEKQPESVLLELLGGIHGGLTEAAGAWALKHGLKLLLPKGLEPTAAARQLLAESAGRAGRALEEHFPAFQPGAISVPTEGSGVRHPNAQDPGAPQLPVRPTSYDELSPEHQQLADRLGPNLTIEDYDHPEVKAHLDDLAGLDPGVLEKLRQSGLHIHTADKPVPELAGLESLRNRADALSGVPMDASPAAFGHADGRPVLALGTLAPDVSYVEAGASPALHEVGHALASLLDLEDSKQTARAFQTFMDQQGSRPLRASQLRIQRRDFVADVIGHLLDDPAHARQVASRGYLEYLSHKIGL